MNLKEAVEKVFNKRWDVESTKISLSLLDKYAENEEIISTVVTEGNYGGLLDGCVCTESHPGGSLILDLVYGRSRVEAGEHFNRLMNQTIIQTAHLSTAEIAELLYLKGSLTLVNPKDAIEIYDDVINYLDTIEWQRSRRFGYVPPPEEDIEAFSVLVNMIEELAIRQENHHKASDAVHDFFKGSFTVISGEIHNPKPTVELNGANRPKSTVYKGYKEKLYDFRKT